MPLRIAYDSQIFCSQQFGGISRYFASVARELATVPGVRPQIVAPFYVNDYVARLPPELVWGRRVRPGRARVAMGALSAALGEVVRFVQAPDVVHQTYYYPQPRAPRRRAPVVVSVYDMAYERFPENFRRNESISAWKRKSVARADHVICISEHTRRDLLELCDVAPEKVSVTYLGFDSLVSLLVEEPQAQVRRRFCGTDRPYLLYVGSRTGCKNFPALIRGFAATALRSDFTLLCFGGGAFTPAEQELIAQAGLTEQVRWAAGPDATLASCYRHAAAFVYPSLYEGFGIPPLEAMSLDCPVVCSNASSIPEVVGDAAVTFDPSDIAAMTAALERVLGSEELRTELITRGRRRCEVFSWSRCAAETLDIYRKVSES